MKKIKYLLFGIMVSLISIVSVNADRGLYLSSELQNSNINVGDEFIYKVKLDYGSSLANEIEFNVAYDSSYIVFQNCTETSNKGVKLSCEISNNSIKATVNKNGATINNVEISIKFIALESISTTPIKLSADLSACANDLSGDCDSFNFGTVSDQDVVRNVTINSIKNEETKSNEFTNDEKTKSDELLIALNNNEEKTSNSNYILYASLALNAVLVIVVVAVALKKKNNN